MNTVTLTRTLSGALATAAGEAGLLTSESLAALLRSEVRRRRIDNLFAAIGRFDWEDTGILGIEEIAAEIAVARAERRSRASGS